MMNKTNPNKVEKMKTDKKNWIVEMRCDVTKLVTCQNCTLEEAKQDPWLYAEDELEVELYDWQVIKVREDI